PVLFVVARAGALALAPVERGTQARHPVRTRPIGDARRSAAAVRVEARVAPAFRERDAVHRIVAVEPGRAHADRLRRIAAAVALPWTGAGRGVAGRRTLRGRRVVVRAGRAGAVGGGGIAARGGVEGLAGVDRIDGATEAEQEGQDASHVASVSGSAGFGRAAR